VRVVSITGLYPRSTAPALGVFIHQRVRAMAAEGMDVRVVSPLPWVPPGPVPRRHAKVRSTPPAEEIDGIPVIFPRYLMLPRVGMRIQAAGYARGLRRPLRRVVADFRPDLIDAHYLYPDACGVARVAREIGLPYVCSARGSDVKVLSAHAAVHRQVRAALADAAAVVAVSRDLAETMRERRLFDGPIDVIPNGVDTARFRPIPRAEARRRLGLPDTGTRFLCVGHLVPVHGQDLLLHGLAHADAPRDAVVDLVGDGPQANDLRRLASDLGIAGRVILHGEVPHAAMPDWLAASNGAIQLSRSAGSPNAVLEALACGIPVLVTDLREMREALAGTESSIFVRPEPAAIGAALRRLPLQPPPSGRPRTWADVAKEIRAVFERVLAGARQSGQVLRSGL
jgi:glycosyltransferase involved in cell wall biosynthesis